MVDFRDVNDTNFEEKAGKLLEQIQFMNGSQTNISAVPSLSDSQTSIIQDPGKGRCFFEIRVLHSTLVIYFDLSDLDGHSKASSIGVNDGVSQ